MVRTLVATFSDFAIGRSFAGRGARRRTAPAVAVDPRLSAYGSGGVEPPLEDVLGDPIIQLVMQSDRLEPKDVRTASSAAVR